uniref:Uncharacterized protein n=1 Tax=Lactuca sativa TaxID=4236 RepID=A0A9R1XC06_LACSA|nr:hypothetical protein LSAT_V11C500289030 [Lactuca sativa]
MECISGIKVVLIQLRCFLVPATSSKGARPSMLEGKSGYGSTMQDSPKFRSGDYPAATQKYFQKIMWKLNKFIAKESLPTYPVGFAIEPDKENGSSSNIIWKSCT